jgi:hypothetical protein
VKRIDHPAMALIASALVLCLATQACISFKTNTDIRVEPYEESVTIYKADAGAADGYTPQIANMTRYRLAKSQVTIFDLGATILDTLEFVGSACLSIAMAMMLTQANSLSHLSR